MRSPSWYKPDNRPDPVRTAQKAQHGFEEATIRLEPDKKHEII
ncbi:hypothetical protein COL8621_01338 [Actibacterium lipolyticum]|uniref:Uncharacterized protein n=1 Tax=Actibacterium lipolyticum TaxID=1524263 RepID=A0A238JV75_9RHOB|nr:hypothetical protein COL8621_01338 [Actibacterium lipolyticum]